MDQIVMKPKGWLRPPRHGRSSFDQTELRHLAENLAAVGFINPLTALPTGEVVAGDRRRQAAMLCDKITEVPVLIIADLEKDRDIRIRRISENLQRVDLSFWEKYLECRGFRDDEPDMTAKEIAELINVDASSVTRYLCLDHCVEAVRRAAMENRITMRACYDLSKAPKEQQEALLAEALSGTKARKQRPGAVAGARLARIRFTTPSGYLLAISGEEMTLEDAAKELTDAAAEMRKAEKAGHDVKTYMALCRKRSEDNG